MPPKSEVQDELDALQRELKQGSPADADRGARSFMAGSAEFERLVQEIQDRLKDAAEDTEDVISKHPLVAVASAFLLGVVVGRLIGRA